MLFDILGLIVIGLIIGALARLLLPGKQHISIVATLVLGVLGAIIGGLIASLIGTGDIFELNILGFILAVIAALVLVGGYAGMAGRSNRSVRH
ncbi:GlsB/YeaQ/YmgE family stress response membrane protein [Blastococcus sp. SYSU DS0539]